MWALGDKVASSIVAQSADIPTLPWSGSGDYLLTLSGHKICNKTNCAICTGYRLSTKVYVVDLYHTKSQTFGGVFVLLTGVTCSRSESELGRGGPKTRQ